MLSVYTKWLYKNPDNHYCSEINWTKKPMVQTDNSQSHWFSLSKYILWFFYNFYEEIVKESFNTSHVTLYRRGYDMSYMSKRSFNTSHVTLYHSWSRNISGHYSCFNTSHVTLYPGKTKTVCSLAKFQYITCYSLSEKRHNRTARKRVSIHHMLLFIVISLIDQPSLNDVSIHHMLLFILTRKYINRLNAVYIHHMLLFIDQGYWSTCEAEAVSIHHMLLFIAMNKYYHKYYCEFQYITCYSLSMELAGKVLPKERFNTSHVTLYRIQGCKDPSDVYGFNTSHVTLYRWMLMLLCKTISSFNTSHVTLYREAARRHVIWLMFQYITCYSLS